MRFVRTSLNLIYDYKTAFYTFYAPIACSMVLAGLRDPKQLKVVEDISLLLGELFQAQDDYLDCFGDPAHIGKIGTDIQDHKCTWLLVQALDRIDQDEMEILKVFSQPQAATAKSLSGMLGRKISASTAQLALLR
jgi:farnesyl diphosphate synthase